VQRQGPPIGAEFQADLLQLPEHASSHAEASSWMQSILTSGLTAIRAAVGTATHVDRHMTCCWRPAPGRSSACENSTPFPGLLRLSCEPVSLQQHPLHPDFDLHKAETGSAVLPRGAQVQYDSLFKTVIEGVDLDWIPKQAS